MSGVEGRTRTDVAVGAASTFAVAAQRTAASVREYVAGRRDPRMVHLRKLRRARQAGKWWGSATGTTAVIAGSGALAGVPELVAFCGGASVVMLVPTTVTVSRFVKLRRAPVPPRAHRRIALPAVSSAGYKPVRRLAESESDLLTILAALRDTPAIPRSEIDDIDSTAEHAADAILDYSQRLQQLEGVMNTKSVRAVDLKSPIQEIKRELDDGVKAYQSMATAAAHALASAHSRGTSDALPHAEMLSAAEKLQAWALAIDEIAPLRGTPDLSLKRLVRR